MIADSLMTTRLDSIDGPHAGQPAYLAGEPLESARAAMVMVHGRGATAEDILSLRGELALPGVAYLAPQAAGGTWYPERFMAPLERNEPWLSSALAALEAVLAHSWAAGISAERTVLLGFSQGACLALEYAARHPRRYGGVAGLSGALIGPDSAVRPAVTGNLEGTPVFLGCSDVDPHIPRYRVDSAAEELERLGADVTKTIYQGMGHTVNRDELNIVRDMLSRIATE